MWGFVLFWGGVDGLLSTYIPIKTGFQSLLREKNTSLILPRMSKARGVVYSGEKGE